MLSISCVNIIFVQKKKKERKEKEKQEQKKKEGEIATEELNCINGIDKHLSCICQQICPAEIAPWSYDVESVPKWWAEAARSNCPGFEYRHWAGYQNCGVPPMT